MRWQTAQSGSLIFIPGATEEEHELLYIVEHLENGVTLLIGISDKSLMETLFANRAHRSYKLEQMVVHLPNGGLGYRDEQKKVTFIGRTWDVLTNRNEVFESNTYLMMRYRSASPAYTLIAILSPTGTGQRCQRNAVHAVRRHQRVVAAARFLHLRLCADAFQSPD